MKPAPAALALVLALAPIGVRADDLGLKVAPGFRVSVYADETLANDTYAMTIDARGRVAVSTQGEIKLLEDSDRDGRADRAALFARTPTGAMGLCFDGSDLLACADGWLSRYRDADGDGRADGPPERIVPLKFAEHGGHAMRRGPDGWWYVIGGNDSTIDRRHVTRPDSPVHDPEAGAILRLPPDLRSCGLRARGFRNPYDFDFNADGELFTYDSDVEREYFLPWYNPTRVFHVARGGHHGWRLTGFMRGWSRFGYYADAVDVLWPVGRGSPTGVTCYRHNRFPAHYRDGLFVLDWTFGKVYFFALEPDGASYRTRAEVFIEPTGSHGFDPTDVAVAPDGALLISIGGRRTRGSVYRVEPVETPADSARPASRSELDAVLAAPQPLDAWSRAVWMPAARRLGREAFVSAVTDETRPEATRQRVIEVLTELFGGLPADAASAGARSASPRVRARVAWSLGRTGGSGADAILAALAADAQPKVRLAALDALDDLRERVAPATRQAAAMPNLGQGDKRVRQAAARLAAGLDDSAWAAVREAARSAGSQARLTSGLAAIWRDPAAPRNDDAIDAAVAALDRERSPDLQLQALRLIVRALGDWNLDHPSVEIDSGYSLPRPVPEPVAKRVLAATRSLVAAPDERVSMEATRIAAMLEDDDPENRQRVMAEWTADSSATRDVHHLIVVSRLPGPRGPADAETVAGAVLALDGKLEGKQQRTKQTWNDRLAEAVAALVARDPRLADALLAHRDFLRPAHVALAAVLDAEHRRRAAERFRDAVRADPEFEWSAPLVVLLRELPKPELRPLLREHWSDVALHDSIAQALAAEPEAVDRERFLEGLDSVQPQIIATCLAAIEELPRDETPEHLVPLLRLLRRLCQEPREAATRSRTVALYARQSGEPITVTEKDRSPRALEMAYRPLFDQFAHRHPKLVAALEGDESESLAAWETLRPRVAWPEGRADRGEALFRARSCRTCHDGVSRVGPDLAGVTSRFSRDDLFLAIAAPNREVAPPYRVTLVETRDGKIVAGIVVFESADGLIVQAGAGETLRIATSDIASRQPGQRSLMPTGLLKDLQPGDVADLYAYLATLAPTRGEKQ